MTIMLFLKVFWFVQVSACESVSPLTILVNIEIEILYIVIAAPDYVV